MPAAPAPGGRIITVGPPTDRIKRGAFDGVALVVLAIAALATIVWRVVRRARVRHPIL